MTIEQGKSFLLGCAVINYGILLLWFVVFVLAHDWLYRVHTRWFKLSVESFEALNYGSMAVYKIGVLLLNVVPLLVLYLTVE